MINNNMDTDTNYKNIIEGEVVKEIAIEKEPVKNIAMKIFVIMFIISMLLGYVMPILNILNK